MAALQPDLVVVASRSASYAESFSQKWPTIDTTVSWEKDGDYTEQARSQVKLLGQATGHETEAARAIKTIDATVKRYTDTARDRGSAAVVMVSGSELSLHGARSRWAPLFDVFGFTPVELSSQGADEGHKGQKISFETLADLDPEWIFVVDRDAAIGQGNSGTSAKQSWRTTSSPRPAPHATTTSSTSILNAGTSS
ncbi:ABC transporter substrate-binding protein [Nanchangia anserum]|uniref:ABC transporter substrate-binding protein n=1 Tax=Nanchangia anserum TaxID=2692125 RepID=UPI00188348A3|nr:ABC transporter substrate-binding protein [Nanchangia anserum]QOX82562.1 ABC transporter substrate-binding protein [Nanchangia anserum]